MEDQPETMQECIIVHNRLYWQVRTPDGKYIAGDWGVESYAAGWATANGYTILDPEYGDEPWMAQAPIIDNVED